MQWENVYVFISSTFNDMHAERDYLVKRVFPLLSAWCEERKLRLVDIDLRWGVSEADATENKRVVQVCLDRIDACRPFFLCFLGQRRGWVPEESEISGNTYEKFPKLLEKHYSGSASVTEMEILHALIDPLHNGILRLAGDATQDFGPADYAFFFLRNPGYLSEITHPDAHRIYTNEAETDPTKADAELSYWREEVIPQTGRPVYGYSADWDESKSTPEIALPLYVPTTAPQGSEIWNSVFVRWARMWESKGVKVSDSGEITDQAELAKANAYNQSFTNGRLGAFRHDGTELAEIIIETLKAAIIERFGERTEPAQTPLQHELDQQAQFLQVASEGFIERVGDFDALCAYLEGAETKPFGLTAYAGMGKTSLLAHFMDTYQPKETDETLHYRFVGGSDDSVSVERLVRSLLTELKERGKIESEIPLDTADMLNKLIDLLKEAGQKGKTILIIDALNQLESGMSNLSWIPAALPENIKLIVSFKRGEADAEEYYAQLMQNQTMLIYGVTPFDSMDDRKKLVTAYLDRYFKELDEPRIQALIGSDGAENPLFLKVALSELRVFGVHNDLSAMIKSSFGNTPVSAYNTVLARMESDPAYTKLSPSISLPHVFGWLSHSKYGLSVEELCDLLIREKLTDSRADAQDAVYLILRQLRPYLAKRDGRIDFFFESFKIAAAERYTKGHTHARTGQEWHRSLAEYFETLPLKNRHRLMEQAWQCAKAGMGQTLLELLFEYPYLDAKLHEFDTGSLESDFNYVLFPEVYLSQTDLKASLLLRDSITISAHILSKRNDQLASQLWIRLIGTEEPLIKNFLTQIVREMKERHVAWLRPRAGYGTPGGALKRTLEHGRDVNQVAISHQGKYIYSTDDLCDIKQWDASTGSLIMTYEGGIFAITPDEKQILTITEEFSVKLIDIFTGKTVRDFNENHETKITDIAISEDGYTAVSCSNDGTFKVWDIQSGKCTMTVMAHDKYVHCVAISKDGDKVLTGSMDATMKLWRIKGTSAELEYTFSHSGSVMDDIYDVAFTRDGQKALSASQDKTICLWNLTSRSCEMIYKGHGHFVNGFSVSSDEKYILSASVDRSLKLWELETGICLKTFEGHTGSCNCAVFFPDNVNAVSGSYDETLKLWDTSGEPGGAQIEEHGHFVTRMALSPDENILMTGARDEKIIFWNQKNCKSLYSRQGHRGETAAIRFSCDGRYALTGGALDNSAWLWDVEKGEHTKTYAGHSRWVNAVAFSPDGKTILTGSSDGTLRLWDKETTECIQIFERHEGNYGNVVSAEFSADGKLILSAAVDGTVKLWEAKTGHSVKSFVSPKGRFPETISVCFGADGKSIISSAGYMWNISNGECIKLDRYECLRRMHPNKRYFACKSFPQEAELLDVYTQSVIARFVIDGNYTCSTCTSDGTGIMVGNDNGRVYFLALENMPQSDIPIANEPIVSPTVPGNLTYRSTSANDSANDESKQNPELKREEKQKGFFSKLFGQK